MLLIMVTDKKTQCLKSLATSMKQFSLIKKIKYEKSTYKGSGKLTCMKLEREDDYPISSSAKATYTIITTKKRKDYKVIKRWTSRC